MATTDKTKFSWAYLISGDGLKDWWKAWGTGIRLGISIALVILLILGIMNIWSFFFPKKNQNISKPTTVVLPGGHVDKLDQSTTQVSLDEKPWEVGVGGGGLNYDNKSGVFIGGWVKRKW